MDIAGIARSALEILDRDGWCKNALTMNLDYEVVSEDLDYRVVPGGVGSRPLAFLIGEPAARRGSHCAGGAVNLALTGCDRWNASGSPFYAAMAEVIREQYPEYCGKGIALRGIMQDDIGVIVWWNNHPDTTEDDVRAVLEKLACS